MMTGSSIFPPARSYPLSEARLFSEPPPYLATIPKLRTRPAAGLAQGHRKCLPSIEIEDLEAETNDAKGWLRTTPIYATPS